MENTRHTLKEMHTLDRSQEWTEFPGRVVYDPSGGVVYTPFVSADGRVGYRVTRTDNTDGQETFVYLNPSDDSEGDPNCFVYVGVENDPDLDATDQHVAGYFD